MSPTEEFVYYLAWELRMTVAELCTKMPFQEFLKWQIFMQKKAMLERGEQDPMDMDEADFAKAFGAR